MTEQHTSKPVVIFRRLTVKSLIVALMLRSVGRRVIYIEPLGTLRTLAWVERLSRWGVEWVDYHSYVGYLPNSEYVVAGQYAASLMEKTFSAADLDAFSRTHPGLKGHPKRSRALVYNFLVSSFLPHFLVYALAQYFRDQGVRADIFQPRFVAETLLADHEVSEVRNFFPGWGGAPFLRRVCRSIVQRIYSSVLTRLRAKKVEDIVEHAVGSASELATVLYFPHKGLSYGPLFVKDQYYSDNPYSPFHSSHIQHIELGWMLTDRERAEIQADYDGRGISVIFVDLPKQSVYEKIRTVMHRFWLAPGGRAALVQALMLGQLDLRLQACRIAFAHFGGAKIALLGHDTLFPAVATVALQSYGVQVTAVQERFISAFHSFYAPLLNLYCVHGTIVKETLERNCYAAIDEIIVTGDPRTEKITNSIANASLECDQEFGGGAHVCLVLDFHSVKDPFQNAQMYGPDWKCNKFFYESIITLAQKNSDCAFVIRGKNMVWQSIPAMESVKQAIKTLNNVFVDSHYGSFDRSYELAAMAGLVIARYTSLCDQCLAVGIPVLVFEGTPDGRNVISRWHDYKPYPIIIREASELQSRFDKIIREGVYMSNDQFMTMRRKYYGHEHGDADSTSLTRLHRVLEDVHKLRSHNNLMGRSC